MLIQSFVPCAICLIRSQQRQQHDVCVCVWKGGTGRNEKERQVLYRVIRPQLMSYSIIDLQQWVIVSDSFVHGAIRCRKSIAFISSIARIYIYV